VSLVGYQRPLLRQPDGLARINPRHWLARDLIFAHTGLQGFVFQEPVEPVAAPAIGAVVAATGHASITDSTQFKPNGSGAVDYAIPSGFVDTPATLCAFVAGTSTTTTQPLLSVRRALGSAGGLSLRRTTSALQIVHQDTGASSGQVAGGTIVAGAWMHLCGVFVSDTSRQGFVDGASIGTNITSRTLPTDLTRISVARYVDSANTICGTNITGIALPLVIGRALDAEEVAELHDEQRSNPWVLFSERPIWVPVASGAPAATSFAFRRAFPRPILNF